MTCRPTFYPIETPAYGLSWQSVSDGPNGSVLTIAGGGGSLKSGVKNQIMTRSFLPDATDLMKKVSVGKSCFTDDDKNSSLCADVSYGVCLGQPVLMVAVDSDCLLLRADESSAEGEILHMEPLYRFKADFGVREDEDISCINVTFITRDGFLVSGGDDNIVRVWAPLRSETGEWSTELLYEFRGHESAITCIDEEPNRRWIVTCSKDGTARLWNLITGKLMAIIPAVGPGGAPREALGDISYNTHDADTVTPLPKYTKGVGLSRLECRGAKFSYSLDGPTILYFLQSRRDGSHIVKWRIAYKEHVEEVTHHEREKVADDNVNKDTHFKIRITGVGSQQISRLPCTKLAISHKLRMEDDHDGMLTQVLGVGVAEGSILMIDGESLSVIHSYQGHQMPVTGLAFAPNFQRTLASVSADKTLIFCDIPTPKRGMLTRMLLFFIFLVIAMVLLGGPAALIRLSVNLRRTFSL